MTSLRISALNEPRRVHLHEVLPATTTASAQKPLEAVWMLYNRLRREIKSDSRRPESAVRRNPAAEEAVETVEWRS